MYSFVQVSVHARANTGPYGLELLRMPPWKIAARFTHTSKQASPHSTGPPIVSAIQDLIHPHWH